MLKYIADLNNIIFTYLLVVYKFIIKITVYKTISFLFEKEIIIIKENSAYNSPSPNYFSFSVIYSLSTNALVNFIDDFILVSGATPCRDSGIPKFLNI